MSSPTDIPTLRRLFAAMTQGPYELRLVPSGYPGKPGEPWPVIIAPGSPEWLFIDGTRADGEAILALLQQVPGLLDDLERLRDELNATRNLLRQPPEGGVGEWLVQLPGPVGVELERLRRLEPFVSHGMLCPSNPITASMYSTGCTCGLDAARQPPEPK